MATYRHAPRCRQSLTCHRGRRNHPSRRLGLGCSGIGLAPGRGMENLTSHVAGSVVLITGGNAGIGRAAALEFAKQGAKVVVSGRREREGEEVVRSEERRVGKECGSRCWT